MNPLRNPGSTSTHFGITKSMFRASLSRDVNYRVHGSGGRCDVEEEFFLGRAYRPTGKLYNAHHVRMACVFAMRIRRALE